MTEREARIAFNLIPNIGAVKLGRLAAAAGGSAAEAFLRFPDKTNWLGEPVDWQREIERADKLNIRIVTEEDPEYPPQLKDLPSPPLALYIVGDPTVLAKPGVAIIGTRAATEYGRSVAEQFACGLANRGWAVFSGLAAGIDAAAHRGALLAGEGLTAGILGGAIDEFFPAENRELAREMVHAKCCVASEFPLGRRPDAQTFPQRNRVVAGLSRGVVAVECPLKSGTIITCNRALEQGRAVMAVPGRIDSKTSAGCLQLLREGAHLVTCVDDIIEELSPLASLAAPQPRAAAAADAPAPAAAGKPKRAATAATAPAAPRPPISADEAALLRAIPDEGILVDNAARAAGVPVSRASAMLVGLKLKGMIRFLPGNRVAPAAR